VQEVVESLPCFLTRHSESFSSGVGKTVYVVIL
jgi:hypothetical protein